jgi:nicotinamidase-related amidase
MLEPSSTALVLMDFQSTTIDLLNAADAAERANQVRSACRARDVLVVFIRVAYRPGYPEISSRNLIGKQLVSAGMFLEGAAGTEISPIFSGDEPAPNEVTLTKTRVGAFRGTGLDALLRAHDVQTVVLAGIATSGVVLSTVRDAADRDYNIVVLRDCCADRDTTVHQVLMDHVFPRQAVVLTSEELAFV